MALGRRISLAMLSKLVCRNLCRVVKRTPPLIHTFASRVNPIRVEFQLPDRLRDFQRYIPCCVRTLLNIEEPEDK